jgi:hypothetical protein
MITHSTKGSAMALTPALAPASAATSPSAPRRFEHCPIVVEVHLFPGRQLYNPNLCLGRLGLGFQIDIILMLYDYSAWNLFIQGNTSFISGPYIIKKSVKESVKE